MTAATPGQAAAHAFVTGCVKRGITASQAAVPPEGQLATVRGLWADVAQAGHEALAAQEPHAADGLVAQLRDLAKHWEREYVSDQNWPQQCACELVRLLDKTGTAQPRPAPGPAAAVTALMRVKGILNGAGLAQDRVNQARAVVSEALEGTAQ